MKPDDLPDPASADVEIAMKRLSISVSCVALVLMCGGLVWFLAEHGLSSWPGAATARIVDFIRPGNPGVPLLAMSTGIILLSLLPGARVFVALGIYMRRRKTLDFFAGLIVILELLTTLASIGF